MLYRLELQGAFVCEYSLTYLTKLPLFLFNLLNSSFNNELLVSKK